jgi:hypothetical protein
MVSSAVKLHLCKPGSLKSKVLGALTRDQPAGSPRTIAIQSNKNPRSHRQEQRQHSTIGVGSKFLHERIHSTISVAELARVRAFLGRINRSLATSATD